MRSKQKPLDVLLAEIKGKRRQIDAYVARGTRFTSLGIICAAIAGVLTATPTIGGASLTDALGAAGPSSPSWRILCGAATLFSLAATILTSMFRTDDFTAKLSRAQAYSVKLEILETQAKLKSENLEELSKLFTQYQQDAGLFLPRSESRNWRFWKTPRLGAVTGTIEQPEEGQVVGTTFTCSGSAAGLEPGLHLWLVVESGGSLWPKEGGEISVDDDGSWGRTVFEEGSVEVFSLALWVVDAKGDRYIRRWFKRCLRIKDYPELCTIPNMHRVTMVNNLHRVLDPQTGKTTQRPPAEPVARNA